MVVWRSEMLWSRLCCRQDASWQCSSSERHQYRSLKSTRRGCASWEQRCRRNTPLGAGDPHTALGLVLRGIAVVQVVETETASRTTSLGRRSALRGPSQRHLPPHHLSAQTQTPLLLLRKLLPIRRCLALSLEMLHRGRRQAAEGPSQRLVNFYLHSHREIRRLTRR